MTEQRERKIDFIWISSEMKKFRQRQARSVNYPSTLLQIQTTTPLLAVLTLAMLRSMGIPAC